MDKKRQWMLLTALGTVVVLVAGFMFLVKPEHKKAHDLTAQATTIAHETDSLKVTLAQLVTEKAGLAAEQAKLRSVQQKLPAGPQLPALTRALDKAAKSAGVELVNVSPSAPAANSSATTTSATTTSATKTSAAGSAAAGTAAASTPTVDAIPVVLSVSGSYFNLEKFLDNLEGMQRALLVDGFTIAFQSNPATAAVSATPRPTIGGGELTITLQTRVFMTSAPLHGASAATIAQ